MSTPRCKTQVLKKVIDVEKCKYWYTYLKENIKWEESVRSKKGFTRNGKLIDLAEYMDLYQLIYDVIQQFNSPYKYKILMTYLNNYENGEMWSPNHTHPKMHSLVISLGATRNFNLNKKIIEVENGDAIMFGSAVHGVPKQPEVKEGRISIAVFLSPI